MLDRPTYRISFGYLALTIIYLGLISSSSALPGSATGPNTPFWRLVSNLSHIPLFAGLGLCLAMTFRYWPWRARSWVTLGVGLAYALFDEYQQSWVPGRKMSALDVGLDSVGLVTGLLFIWLVSGWWRRALFEQSSW